MRFEKKIGNYTNSELELLEKYTQFLLKNGYVDSDVYDEGNAIDEFTTL